MKTIHTKHNQLCIWPSDLGCNPDGSPWHAVVIGLPFAAPTEGLGVAQVFLTVQQARELSLELGWLIARIDEMMAKETA
jgi:hypothetical protein